MPSAVSSFLPKRHSSSALSSMVSSTSFLPKRRSSSALAALAMSSPSEIVQPTKPILRKAKSCVETTSTATSLYDDDTRKEVWFDSVEVNYHNIILGDNPAVSGGAPITIGWDSIDHEVYDIDCYEMTRKAKYNHNHSNNNNNSTNHPNASSRTLNMKVPVQDRAKILLQSGYSLQDLARMTQQVQDIQRQRAQSLADSQKWDRFNVFAESSGKVFRKLARGITFQSNTTTNNANNASSRNPAA